MSVPPSLSLIMSLNEHTRPALSSDGGSAGSWGWYACSPACLWSKHAYDTSTEWRLVGTCLFERWPQVNNLLTAA